MSTASEPTERVLPRDWAVPVLRPENRAFFTTGELRIQRCLGCGNVQHPPIELCHRCQAFDFDDVSGGSTGEVAAVTVVHHPIHALLQPAVPYAVVVVVLDDHPTVRVVGNIVDAVPADVQIGSRVTVCWASVRSADGDEEILLPQWRLIDRG